MSEAKQILRSQSLPQNDVKERAAIVNVQILQQFLLDPIGRASRMTGSLAE
jgi:hypothetical protein